MVKFILLLKTSDEKEGYIKDRIHEFEAVNFWTALKVLDHFTDNIGAFELEEAKLFCETGDVPPIKEEHFQCETMIALKFIKYNTEDDAILWSDYIRFSFSGNKLEWFSYCERSIEKLKEKYKKLEYNLEKKTLLSLVLSISGRATKC